MPWRSGRRRTTEEVTLPRTGAAFAVLPSSGVGIDLQDFHVVDHLSPTILCRAAIRWLEAGELAWCESQISFRSSLLIVLCCKEAVFKASRGPCLPHQISLNLQGGLSAGQATWNEAGSPTIHAAWRSMGKSVLALAAGERFGAPASLLQWLDPVIATASSAPGDTPASRIIHRSPPPAETS
jgi:phosphopantetheinyl transferase (holo-ACP synthase)